MNKRLLFIAYMILLLAVVALALLSVAFHRVVVIEGISGTPISGAYISIQRSSGSSEDAGRTGANGELFFWTSPLPVPELICAQSTFYPMNCVNAISLTRQVIELAVPANSP